MAKKRTMMKKIRDVFRLKFDAHLSNRDVAHCLKMGAATVSDLLGRFRQTELPWPLPEQMTDKELEAKLYPAHPSIPCKALPDFAAVHQELKRKGMTKLLLWQEYLADNPNNAYQYSQFCDLYRKWRKKQRRSMRQIHIAGEKCFIDYCGPTVPIVNPATGEIRHAQIFVATLGASSYTYIEATNTQSKEDWLLAHSRAFRFFGGVPRLLVPDNLKSAVTHADRYEPRIQENYQQLARHYGTAIMPARPYKPKDKAKAENAVQLVERWILMRIRHHTFYSLSELNKSLQELLHELNNRPFRQQPGNRQSLFEQLEKPALQPLPSMEYEYQDHHPAKVGIDYHVLYQKHAYSVPHHFVGERVEIIATQRMVRIYANHQCIAQHMRSLQQGGFTTVAEHMPDAHQQQRWSSQRLLSWGRGIGSGTESLVRHLLTSRDHPEQAFRSCLGLLNLSRKYSDARLEQACRKALLCDYPSRTVVANLLKNGLEQCEIETDDSGEESLQNHANLRGADYYRQRGTLQ